MVNVLLLPGCGLVNGPSLACVTPKQRKTRMLATIPLKKPIRNTPEYKLNLCFTKYTSNIVFFSIGRKREVVIVEVTGHDLT